MIAQLRVGSVGCRKKAGRKIQERPAQAESMVRLLIVGEGIKRKIFTGIRDEKVVAGILDGNGSGTKDRDAIGVASVPAQHPRVFPQLPAHLHGESPHADAFVEAFRTSLK
jgi:hypothetical protein